MNKILFIVISIIFLLSSFACSQEIPVTSEDPNAAIESRKVDQTYDKQTQEAKLIAVRNEVIEKFRSERNELGVAKFIEDSYKTYPEDEIISAIYNYQSSLFCYEFYVDMKDSKSVTNVESWLTDAKAYASKIPPTYNDVFSEEIIPYVSELLGEEWKALREIALEQDENFKELTKSDKIEIYNYILDQFKYYDSKEGTYTGDKYSDEIWKEVSEKYGISESQVTQIYIDDSITKAIAAESNPEDEEPKDSDTSISSTVKYDATLNYEGGNALIAVSQEAIDEFFDALISSDQDALNVLYNNGKVAQVPPGTKVKVISKKALNSQVEIMSGTYTGNIVWVLTESIHY